jgi:hypothetical protein
MKSDLSESILTSLTINPLPAPERMNLLLDEAFCTKLNIKQNFLFPLGSTHSVEAESLHNALRAAVAGEGSAKIRLKGGRQLRVKLGLESGGKVKLTIKKEELIFGDTDLLSERRQTRMNALQRIFLARSLAEDEEESWRKLVRHHPPSHREFVVLMTTLGATPEALIQNLQKPQDLSSDRMMPTNPEYYDRLTAQLRTSKDLETFIVNELSDGRRSLMGRSRSQALRRIAFSALWQPLIPFEMLGELSVNDVAPLLDAEDPFSLLFGFELCRALLEQNGAFAELGSSFLEKLFGDPATRLRRFEVFTGCAIISLVELRRAAKAAEKPTFWVRLAALIHAGVLAEGLGALPDSKGFLDWAMRNFSPHYVWHSLIDRHESPRWKPDWIAPIHLFAELVGRANNSVHMLSENIRPPKWASMLKEVHEHLAENGKLLATVFPGPFDDFRDSQTSSSFGDMFADTELQLATASRIADVPGLTVLTYASLPSDHAKKNVERILEQSADEPISDMKSELPHLQLSAHFALAAQSEPIAQAVINRCFFLARDTAARERTTDLFAIIIEACAVYREEQKYRRMISENAARMSYVVNDQENHRRLIAILDVLIQRDNRLSPSLAKARAILSTKLGRI